MIKKFAAIIMIIVFAAILMGCNTVMD